jgi:hypothetical protein
LSASYVESIGTALSARLRKTRSPTRIPEPMLGGRAVCGYARASVRFILRVVLRGDALADLDRKRFITTALTITVAHSFLATPPLSAPSRQSAQPCSTARVDVKRITARLSTEIARFEFKRGARSCPKRRNDTTLTGRVAASKTSVIA